MRKTILSILLALCMMCTLLPVTAGADEPAGGSTNLEDVTFGYAYDAQRNIAYPKKGETVTLTSITYPLGATGTSLSTSSGNWKLTKVGAYSTITDSTIKNPKLIEVVNGLANQYKGEGETADTDSIIIHKLENGTEPIAYGVLVAYDSTQGRALFLGNNRSTASGGVGYILSTTVMSGTGTIKAEITLRDLTKAIFLSPSSHTFTAATEGYAAQTPLTVTVTNNGNAAIGALNVTLSGDKANAFTLSTNKIDGITVGNTATFTVAPITGLAAGTYTATVTVSNGGSIEVTPNTDGVSTQNITNVNNDISETLTVTFTVNEGEATPEPPAEPTHDHTRRQNTTTTTDTTPATTVASPKTGDMGIAVYAALSIMSVTGSAWIVGTKRRH